MISSILGYTSAIEVNFIALGLNNILDREYMLIEKGLLMPLSKACLGFFFAQQHLFSRDSPVNTKAIINVLTPPSLSGA